MLAELSIEQAGSINVMTLMRHYIDWFWFRRGGDDKDEISYNIMMKMNK